MSNFVNNVRKGIIKGPQQRGFTLDEWEKAFQSIQGPDDADKALFLSGEWFAAEFENARHMTSQCAKFVNNTAPLDVILGFITHQWAVIKDKTEKIFEANAPNKEFVSEQISEMRISNVMGVPFDPEVALEILVDGARFPLSFQFLTGTTAKPFEPMQFEALSGIFILGGY
jgi:hypothetical protein